jgi:hypothetical protein
MAAQRFPYEAAGSSVRFLTTPLRGEAMHYALPHPQHIIAVSLAALALGAGGGVAVALIVDEDDVVSRSSAPAANVSVEPRDTPAPAPERVSPAPSSSDRKFFPKSGAPIPGRVSPSAEPRTGSLAGTASPEPERISGVRMR